MAKVDSIFDAVKSISSALGPSTVKTFVWVFIAGWFTARVADNVNKYVIQSAENNSSLVTAMVRVEGAHEMILGGIGSLQSSAAKRDDTLARVTDTLKEIQTLIDEAKKTMAGVPQQRAEELRLLQQIDTSLRELCTKFEQVNGGNDDKPNP